ncbi:MAG: hypothetical protein COA62_02845 [Rhodobiaceae bacterium]|nr:MAG: hypothetical protein COA62_02845 [Rhodobiaceae bacterium]
MDQLRASNYFLVAYCRWQSNSNAPQKAELLLPLPNPSGIAEKRVFRGYLLLEEIAAYQKHMRQNHPHSRDF